MNVVFNPSAFAPLGIVSGEARSLSLRPAGLWVGAAMGALSFLFKSLFYRRVEMGPVMMSLWGIKAKVELRSPLVAC